VNTAERTRALKAIATKANKKHGAGTVIVASDALPPAPRVSTGSLAQDVALGGGWPSNQWHEIVGHESGGKTLTAFKTVRANQLSDPDFLTVWVAAEGFDEGYADLCGVDRSRIILVNTNVMEEAYEEVLEYLDSKLVDLIVIDSYPALTPVAELGKTMEERAVGQAPYVTNAFFRKSYKATKRSLVVHERPVTGLFINQWRQKIGVMYGDDKTTGGGQGKNYRFYSRVEVKRDEWMTTQARGAGEKYGQVTKFRTIKNKSAPPQQVAVIDFYFRDYNGHDAGSYDNVKEIANLAMLFDIAEKRGNGYVFNDTRYVGKQGLFDAIANEPELREMMSKAVLIETKGGGRLPDDPEMAEAAAKLEAAEAAAIAEDDEPDDSGYVSPAARHRQAAEAKHTKGGGKTKTVTRRRKESG
jgi:recombination protein RecA